MIYQMDMEFTAPILSVIMMFFLILLNLYAWHKVRNWLLVFVIFMFSMIFGVVALSIEIPFTPYFQIFFIIVQLVILFLMSFRVYKYE
jgi:hypothetical protein